MKKSILAGFAFIGIAVLIIVTSLDLLQGIGFWTIFLTVAFAFCFVEGVVDLSAGSIIFSIAFLYMIWDKPLKLPQIPAVSLLLAALFATIGIDLLLKRARIEKFKKRHMERFEKHINAVEDGVESFEKFSKSDGSEVEYDYGEHIVCKSRYGGVKKYITSQNLKSVLIDLSFGGGEIYFDQANAPSGVVDLEVDVSCGSVRIYLPKSWNLENHINNSMGAVREKGTPDGQNLVTVRAVGEINAGAVEIRYI